MQTRNALWARFRRAVTGMVASMDTGPVEINLVYWLGQVSESDRLRVRLQPAVEQHGTPGQRAVYFQNIVWIEFRRNHSVATAETVALIKAALAAQQETGNQAGIPAAQFGVGFALLWSGDPQGAMEPLQIALARPNRLAT
jgi:hypothetical protein